jgi:hypothetical protein
LVQAAIQNGGKRMDHFDGFLTGLYRRNGFKINNVMEWDDQYAPTGWKHQAINITDPKVSVYANEYAEGPKKGTPEWSAKKAQYLSGKPDVIFRNV